MRDKYDFKGKNIVITGASEGLGFETAKNFLKKNANLIICSSNKKKLSNAEIKLKKYKSDYQKLNIFKVDVSNAEQISNFIVLCKKKLKSIDVFINNAGVYGPIGPFEKNDWNEWTRAININLLGPILFTKLIIPILKKQKRGKIIQLSGGGATNPMPNFSSYAVSKTGIVRFVESISYELKNYNIDINAIAPGVLKTKMLEQVLNKRKDIVGKVYYEKLKIFKKNNQNHFVKPIDLINFLSSPDSDGISGKIISAIWDNYKKWPKYKNKIQYSDIYVLRRTVGKEKKFKIGDK